VHNSRLSDSLLELDSSMGYGARKI
jgi:hypothetical protein